MRDTGSREEKQFYAALMHLREVIRMECGLQLNGLRTLLDHREGADPARELLRPNARLDTFSALLSRGRADLTVEYIVLQDRWRGLFTDVELNVARARLGDRAPQYGHR